ncbi:MAG: adenosine kinase [Polyangiaceae bacterium]|nr:adenosine kinase [Polyangiaceae bacterium]
MSTSEINVIGIGNAIVDVLAHTDDEFLQHQELEKGGMMLIDASRADKLYELMGAGKEMSGGSAGNTMAGIASLGGSGGYIGKVANDKLGTVFGDDLRSAGIEFSTSALVGGAPTARCLILITPDAQRTMNTFLGACVELSPEDIDPEFIKRGKVTYLEGYLYDPPKAQEAFIKAATIAHEAGRKVSLSLSDAFCVDRHRADFLELIRKHVDILFANETEILSLFKTDNFNAAAENVRAICEVSALTLGDKGAVVVHAGDSLEIAAVAVESVVDTTGAGDLYAGGFLHGYSTGRELAECGRIGAIAAAEIISHTGARPETSLAERVRNSV